MVKIALIPDSKGFLGEKEKVRRYETCLLVLLKGTLFFSLVVYLS